MNLVRDGINSKITIVDDDGIVLLEFGFFADEFICTFYTFEPIVISKSVDEVLYNCL